MNSFFGVFAYIGPETIVPLTSLLAVMGGVLLFAWQWICGFCMKCGRAIFGKSPTTTDNEK